MGLLSQTQHFLPCIRGAPHSWNTYQRTGWPPLETGPWLQLSGLLDRPPGLCWWSNILSTHGMVAVDNPSVSQHYSYLNTIVSSVLWGMWVVSSMFRGYRPLWSWLTSSHESKRHFGGSAWVWKHLFPKSNLFYRFSCHVSLLSFLQWWKGGAFLWVCTPFVCSLTFPHAMAEESLMHCLPVSSSLDP